ncbi:MAG: hypothetical protein WD021_06590, partial [Rhodothermales bacterium]
GFLADGGPAGFLPFGGPAGFFPVGGPAGFFVAFLAPFGPAGFFVPSDDVWLVPFFESLMAGG